MRVLTGPTDPLRNAYGIVDFEILADPKQPRVGAVNIKTADGGPFTFAIDPRTGLALVSALIRAILIMDPTLREHLTSPRDRRDEQARKEADSTLTDPALGVAGPTG
jgi:hypothetical protein